MWLFNPNSINNLLLFILLFIMLWYFIARSKKNHEVVFLIIFIVQLVFWQLCFLIRNMYFDPIAAYPLHYFLNSGYTVFSYFALAMFSYYFITPVFQRESRFIFFSGIVVSAAILIYSIAIVFPGGIKTFFDPTLHVYDAEPAPHRKFILLILILLIIITAKNLIYKIVVLRGEQRSFAMNLTIALMTGVAAVVGVSLLQYYYPMNTNIHNTINTYVAGLMFIYFYLVYLSFSKIPFLYPDKTVLLILFIIIIIGSMTSSLTYMIYERVYINDKQDIVKHIAREIEISGGGTEWLSGQFGRLYGDKIGYIISRNRIGGMSRVIFGAERVFKEQDTALPVGTVVQRFHKGDEAKFYCFETISGTDVIHVGVPYLQYRKYVHDFVKAGFVTVLIIIVVLFFFMKFVIFIGLTRPLKRLLAGVAEIRSGNLNSRIEISAQDEIGSIAQQFNLMVRDLLISAENIKRSERKFRDLSGLLPDIVYETDLNLTVTYLNQAGFSITGFETEDLQNGLSLHELLDDDECQRLRSLLLGKPGESRYKIITHRIKKKNGETIFGENNAAVVYEADVPVGLRGVIRDVTEKIQIENNLIQAQKMETIGTLAGGIAHDFNNILTGITGTVSLIEFNLNRLGTLISVEVKSDLGILKQSADRASNMVKQILSLSRRNKPVLERIDLNTVAKNVFAICINSFDKKINLTFNYHNGGAFVMADETQMGQVLLNLCVNARDSMTFMRPEGSEHAGDLSVHIERVETTRELQSRFSEASDRPYCRIRVCDTGVGMDEETISRIFDPFFTTKHKDKGTGLGLTMVYNIVKQHGGFIDINSIIASGTIVDVYIPADDSTVTLERPPQSGSSGLYTGTGTVLLVDDDPVIQKICSDMLTKLGYTVITAMDGQEGVDIYSTRHGDIDAVILDVVMPIKSGNEALDELKNINPDIRVLVSSGYRDDQRIEEMLKKGVSGFIQKPYTFEELSKEISRIITNK